MAKLSEATRDYVADNARRWGKNKDFLLPEASDTPEHVADELSAAFGAPSTIDRGEVAYWRISEADSEHYCLELDF